MAFTNGKIPLTLPGKRSLEPTTLDSKLTGNPATDWQRARARLRGSPQLDEVFGKARLLRLLHATDALAWGLNDIWDGEASYPGAADTVRRVLADELIADRPAEPHPVTLMNMHKSKGRSWTPSPSSKGCTTPSSSTRTGTPGESSGNGVCSVSRSPGHGHTVVFVRPVNAMPSCPQVRREVSSADPAHPEAVDVRAMLSRSEAAGPTGTHQTTPGNSVLWIPYRLANAKPGWFANLPRRVDPLYGNQDQRRAGSDGTVGGLSGRRA